MHRVITRGPVNRGSQNLHGLGDIPTYPEARADGDAQGWSSVVEGDEDQGRQGMPAEAGRAGGSRREGQGEGMRQTRRLQLSVGVSRPQDSSGFSTSWARYGLLRSLFQSPDAEPRA